jgi:hypothetical protein
MIMNKTTKHAVIALLGAVSLFGQLASVRADDVTTPPVPAPTQPDTIPPTTTPPEATAPLVAPPIATPPEPVSPEDKWTFNSPLYMWIAGLNGNVTARGRTANVDASASDILKHADFGFQGYFELAKPRFGFYAQPTYMKLSDSGSAGAVNAKITSELWIVEFGAFYKVFDWEGEHHGSVAALAGGRYWNLDNTLTLNDPTLGKVSRSSSGNLFDPIVGMRYEQYLTKKLHVWFQGDVGGFDISNSQSRFSWQVAPLLGYDFTMMVIKKPSTVFAGYRWLDVQHTEGSGTSKNAYHLTMEGAVLGLNVQLF